MRGKKLVRSNQAESTSLKQSDKTNTLFTKKTLSSRTRHVRLSSTCQTFAINLIECAPDKIERD